MRSILRLRFDRRMRRGSFTWSCHCDHWAAASLLRGPVGCFRRKKKSSFNNLYRSIFHRWGRTILQVSLHTMQLKNDFIYLFIYFANPGLSANGAKTMCSSSICYGYAHHPTKSLRLKVMCWFNFVTDYWLSMQTYLVASFGVRPKPSLLVIMSC